MKRRSTRARKEREQQEGDSRKKEGNAWIVDSWRG